MHATAAAEVRNPLSRLRAIRDPMTIVVEMLHWIEANSLLERNRSPDGNLDAEGRARCIETMITLMRAGLKLRTVWASYDRFQHYVLTLHCILDGVIAKRMRYRSCDPDVSVAVTNDSSWMIEDGSRVYYETRAEWLAAAAKYSVQ